MKAIPSVSMDSDHRMVIAKLKLRKPKPRAKARHKRYRLEKLKDEDTATNYKTEIEQHALTRPENADVEGKWQYLKQKIKSTAEQHIGVKISSKSKKKITPWWTEEVKQAVKNKMKAYRKWKKTRRQEDRETYVIKRNEA